jgi:hypothetical protein
MCSDKPENHSGSENTSHDGQTQRFGKPDLENFPLLHLMTEKEVVSEMLPEGARDDTQAPKQSRSLQQQQTVTGNNLIYVVPCFAR